MAMPITFKVHRHLDDILMAFELNKNNIYILSILSKRVKLLDNGHLHRSALIKTQLCFGTIKNRRQSNYMSIMSASLEKLSNG